MNGSSLARLLVCHPATQYRAKQVAAQFDAAFPGFSAEISQGVRSWNYQAALFARGRQSTAQVNALNLAVGIPAITDEQNVKVTDAEPGQSNHNYGYAVDWDIQDESNNSIDWSGTDAKWMKLIALAQPCGFRSGACFHDQDRPHMELQEVPEDPTAEMIYYLKSVGIEAVWQQANPPLPST